MFTGVRESFFHVLFNMKTSLNKVIHEIKKKIGGDAMVTTLVGITHLFLDKE